jgi:cobalt/nickel transport system permease protein
MIVHSLRRRAYPARRRLLTAALIVYLVSALFSVTVLAGENPSDSAGKWSGVDESVIEKVAKEHGHPPAEPLIDTERGDLLLFLFLIAGAIGGFVAGYSWRRLTEPGRDAGTNGLRTPKGSREG